MEFGSEPWSKLDFKSRVCTNWRGIESTLVGIFWDILRDPNGNIQLDHAQLGILCRS